MIECVTQEITQSDEHTDSGGVPAVAHEAHDVVEGVEEKMWMQLHTQRLELRLRQLRFESRGQKLALAILAIVVERIPDPDHGAVDQQVRTKRSRQARDE